MRDEDAGSYSVIPSRPDKIKQDAAIRVSGILV